mgnify:CR=1 FL=1
MKHEMVQVKYYDHSAYSGDPKGPLTLTEIGFIQGHDRTSDGHRYLTLSVGFDSEGEYNNPYVVVMLDDLISIQRLKATGKAMSWGEFNK